ncbi:hypothetical protein TNCV_3061321 [Trichonephila clavipes]|nr:hypothetical protein TNCV_3061321 [Trichonephila clavipes]
MDKCPDVQTNVWRCVIQDGPESDIVSGPAPGVQKGHFLVRGNRDWIETRAGRKKQKEKAPSSRVGRIVMSRDRKGLETTVINNKDKLQCVFE